MPFTRHGIRIHLLLNLVGSEEGSLEKLIHWLEFSSSAHFWVEFLDKIFPKIKLHILSYNINSKNYLNITSKNYSVTKNVLKPVSVDSRDRD